jgi:hypothetical protein
MEYLIHEGLKCGRSIHQSKRHNKEFVVSVISSEGSFLNIFLNYLHLMIPRARVQFGEIFSCIYHPKVHLSQVSGTCPLP